ncbi:glycosyltransferase [Mycolicibacterium sp. PDY-3]|uniref:glycosyltransferase n=1 Tax=Mycolicibacterium sp. PDY-3 TaxID=3376069 RepID=UPI00378E57EE
MTDLIFYVLASVALVSGVLLVYPYLIYPLILRSLPKRHIRRGCAVAGDGRQFALLFCAYNEAASIPAKLENIRALVHRYPGLSVIAFDDASDDGTADLLKEAAPLVRLVSGAGRSGKAHGMKKLVAQTDAEYLVFTDANVLLDISALDALAACYADPSVGGICGALHYDGDGASSTASVGGTYWRMEERLKDLESETGSVMGADGSIFSLRRRLYPDFPDHVLDDMTVSMECIFRGYRLIKANDVVAYERLVSSRSDEFSRKIRIAARAMSTHMYLAKQLRKLSAAEKFRYISHKLIRWFGAIFLAVCMVSGLAALGMLSLGYAILFAAVLAALFAVGLATKSGIVSSAAEVVVAMVATLIGVIRALRGKTAVTWSPAKSRST